MYVYSTPKFNEQINHYQLHPKFEELRTALEKQSGVMAVRLYLQPFPPYWKRREGKLRLMARLLTIGDEHVICFLDILERKGGDYERLTKDIRKFGEERLDPLISEAAVLTWLTLRKEQEKQRPAARKLPDTIRPWLEPPGWILPIESGDWVIYESEEWVRRFRRRDISDFWQSYYEIVYKIATTLDRDQKLEEWNGLLIASQNNYCVLFSRFETTDPAPRKILFLVSPFGKQPSQAEIAFVVKEAHPYYEYRESRPTLTPKPLSLDDLSPYASRSYPDYLLADDSSWLAIEREEEANLALSAEEERVLRSVSLPAQGQSALPVFINGRAGSGKSTMLLYLFADYLYRKLGQGLPGEPLFLTYSQKLLLVAREGVGRILSSHHRFIQAGVDNKGLTETEPFFRPFRKFLLDLLPASERVNFASEKYISFHRFKKLYRGEPLRSPVPKETNEREALLRERQIAMRLPDAKNWSAELCWHVIRTFVKGYQLEALIEPEDYQEVPRRDRTIADETFNEIYETIWKKWYKQITADQGYWDDQDLVRKVLELDAPQAIYTAIFCDEAQDFTRLELQLVMRLSIFSQYDLEYYSVPSLPFAFAGDPFQTLNPTGFRWASVQAAFYDEVISALDPLNRSGLSINFQELAYNYRSTPAIVKATNLIQLWRRVLFGLPELQPQSWWRRGNFPDPRKFILQENIWPEDLVRYVGNTIIIVPCEEGQEIPYIESDPVLAQIFPKGTIQEPPKNILSAITAKGLEFKRVIIYGFGDACPGSVWSLPDEQESHPVEYEYFFNKLYVAASRATTRLFIVDSIQGEMRLWKHASDAQEIDGFLAYVKNRSKWEESIQAIQSGAPETASEMHEEDPLSIASELKAKGLSLGNVSLLRRAKQYYDVAGKSADSELCEAWALKLEDKLNEAGRLFLKQGAIHEAGVCFWDGMCWEELERYYTSYPDAKSQKRVISTFMVTNPKDISAIKAFTQFLDWALGEAEFEGYPTKQLRAVVSEYTRRISALSNLAFLSPEWLAVGVVLERLDKLKYPGLLEVAGTCYYRAGQYMDAVKCWETCGATQRNEYYLSKASVQGFPENLAWLEKAADHDRIVAEWEKYGRPLGTIDFRWLNSIAPALERKGEYWEAFRVYLRLDDSDKVLKIFAKAVDQSRINLWEELVPLVEFLVRRNLWVDTVDVMSKYFPIVRGHDSDKAKLTSDVVREIAYRLSPEMVTADQRQRLEDFINNQVLSVSDWQQRLTVPEVGAALERIGGFISALQFYERFTSSRDPEQQRFARQRWMATKGKQEDYFKNQVMKERADQTHQQLAKQALDWSLPVDSVLPPYPIDAKGVKGLPFGTRIEQLQEENLRFQVCSIAVLTQRKAKLIQITDTNTLEALRVDLEQGKITGLEITPEYALDGQQFSFDVPSSGYSGQVEYGKGNSRLELAIRGVTTPITLEL